MPTVSKVHSSAPEALGLFGTLHGAWLSPIFIAAVNILLHHSLLIIKLLAGEVVEL